MIKVKVRHSVVMVRVRGLAVHYFSECPHKYIEINVCVLFLSFCFSFCELWYCEKSMDE